MTAQDTRGRGRRRLLGLIALGIVAYLIFLIMTWPAHHAYGAARTQLGDMPLTLHGVEGTAWSGRAALAEMQGLRLEAVRWEVHPRGFVRGALDATLNFRSNEGPGEALVRVHPDRRVQVTDLRARLPMQQVGVLVGAQVRLGGTLALNLPAAAFEAEGRLRSAQGELLWQNASTAMLPQVPLGDLLVTLQPEGDLLHAVVQDNGGPVTVQGTAQLYEDGRYEFRGRLGTREGAAPELVATLRLMGRPDRDGMIPVGFSGRW
ncbi:type II secretion system protein N [Ectothiorhodospiraceae bacterium 2226]|nr:type II secretion system protein N [Ectothiorhodospiraceae bacterium 2226]